MLAARACTAKIIRMVSMESWGKLPNTPVKYVDMPFGEFKRMVQKFFDKKWGLPYAKPPREKSENEPENLDMFKGSENEN
jgi:hypothetical protein